MHPPNRLAAIHRGWIDIKAAMTIGRESVEGVVLAEAVQAQPGRDREIRHLLSSLHRRVVAPAAS